MLHTQAPMILMSLALLQGTNGFMWEAIIALCTCISLVGAVLGLYVKSYTQEVLHKEIIAFEMRLDQKGFITGDICKAHRETELALLHALAARMDTNAHRIDMLEHRKLYELDSSLHEMG